MQEVFICMDDSGKLSEKEDISLFGGIVFLSFKEREKFIHSYKAIIESIKCKYCNQNLPNCTCECVELKSYNLRPKDRRRIINFVKNHYTFVAVINNKKVNKQIYKTPESKGKFTDYVIKMIVKSTLLELMKTQSISPSKETSLHIFIDEDSTKTNARYDLRDSIFNEFTKGTWNYNYGTFYEPIFKNKLNLSLKHRESKYEYDIQAADIITGTTRRYLIHKDKAEALKDIYKFINVIRFYP